MKITASQEKYSVESDGINRVHLVNGKPINISSTPFNLIDVKRVGDFLEKALDAITEFDQGTIEDDFDGCCVKITWDGRNVWIQGKFGVSKLKVDKEYDLTCTCQEEVIENYCNHLNMENAQFNTKQYPKALKIFEELDKMMDCAEKTMRSTI